LTEAVQCRREEAAVLQLMDLRVVVLEEAVGNHRWVLEYLPSAQEYRSWAEEAASEHRGQP
jgi:hypothetical protein